MTAGTAVTPTIEETTWAAASDRRPWLGLGLLGGSVAFTLAVLIFFGAWFADSRIETRASASGLASDGSTVTSDGEWWEDGLIAVCPVH
ncbi:MAG: hypothetical protein O3B04_08395 [Chloroflexi bacterium]|nr:hypothetical protein [Chloroflexota bacterium]MDA1297999.1 hypothetical protein [Chloroflexota bacterium]